jgi:hypothetical protein
VSVPTRPCLSADGSRLLDPVPPGPNPKRVCRVCCLQTRRQNEGFVGSCEQDVHIRTLQSLGTCLITVGPVEAVLSSRLRRGAEMGSLQVKPQRLHALLPLLPSPPGKLVGGAGWGHCCAPNAACRPDWITTSTASCCLESLLAEPFFRGHTHWCSWPARQHRLCAIP